MNRGLSLIVLALALQACAGMSPTQSPAQGRSFAASVAQPTAPPPAGTIYQPASGFGLFMDLRARAVGDVLTVLLVERTDASKESTTSTSKDTSVDTGLPIFGGRQPTYNGNPIFNNSISGSNSFGGKADATQSNSLDGSITVTVAERLPNGNLLVRGEKTLTLNQGEEYIRLEGIVRPVDIGPQNTVASTKLADAKITYSGRGTLADSNRPGWLARFFNKPWFPF